MSRAFVDEDRSGPEELPEIPQSPHPGYITPDGLAMLRSELQRLTETDRPALIATIERGGTDVAEAEGELARLEQRSRYLQGRIGRAIVIDPKTTTGDHVRFGVHVTVVDQNGERMTIQIVGEDEIDPEHGKVSWVSPLARALINHKSGEAVVWHRPIGDLELRIENVEVGA